MFATKHRQDFSVTISETQAAAMVRNLQVELCPDLTVSRYDLVSSFLIATVVLLAIATALLLSLWLANQPHPAANNLADVELVGGMSTDGAIDDALNVEAPHDLRDDPSLSELPSEATRLTQTLTAVTDFSGDVSRVAIPDVGRTHSGKSGPVGSAVGGERAALGSLGGRGGTPREQRWFVLFPARQTLEDYVRQLAHFKIEPAAVFIDESRMIYLSGLSEERPVVRRAESPQDSRLFMTWSGGGHRDADIALFRQAGLDARRAIVGHFYPKETETLLARAERAYQDQPPAQIRRTYFTIVPDGRGYRFRVTRQILR